MCSFIENLVSCEYYVLFSLWTIASLKPNLSITLGASLEVEHKKHLLTSVTRKGTDQGVWFVGLIVKKKLSTLCGL